VELLHYRIVYLGRRHRPQALMAGSPRELLLRERDWLHAVLVALVLGALYAATASHAVITEDDSLFVLSSYFLGIEHPPGYPLFTLIGHFFSQLPLGTVAYRVHLVSVLFGGLTCGLAWLCAKRLSGSSLAAYVAALALGVAPVFWSQAIIADVYTLNTFFMLAITLVALKASPPKGPAPTAEEQKRLLGWIAFLFGLSLSNHWPLMLLVAPGFAVLLWPLRTLILKRLWLLLALFVVGLLPYAWMIYRSWMSVPISFAGPLESFGEAWSFISRRGYAEVDHSLSANWLDHVKFFRFMFGQLLLQLAVVGTLLALVGGVVQWRLLGRRVAAFLTLAFAMPSFVLILLLGFDYGTQTSHVFEVYPLPSYTVCAFWLALGFVWAVERWSLRGWQAGAAAAAIVALVVAAGARDNLLADEEWVDVYARAMLRVLPKDAVVIGQGESDLGPMAYLQIIEGQRPDLTFYQAKGLILGNRLFHPMRTDEQTQRQLLNEMIDRQKTPVVFTPFALDRFGPYARRDRWLFVEVDKSSRDPGANVIDIPDEAVRFFETSVARERTTNGWLEYLQGVLRNRYAGLLARSIERNRAPSPQQRRDVELLQGDFYGVLGLAEGYIAHRDGYSVGTVAQLLDRARALMPVNVGKAHQSHFFYLRGIVRSDVGDRAGALRDFDTSFALWPVADNPSADRLAGLYRATGDAKALQSLQDRLAQLKRRS
jgi:hypothetical protein